VFALCTLLAFGACDKPTAFGEADSLIVVADSTLWSGLEQETYAALEPPVFTVREEKTFNVTFVSNTASELEQLLLWKQVLVFAPPDDPRVQAIVDAAERETAAEPGEIVQADNVWARGQLATAIILDPADPGASWRNALPRLHELLDEQFRQYATSRMWVSGEDTAFAARVADRYAPRRSITGGSRRTARSGCATTGPRPPTGSARSSSTGGSRAAARRPPAPRWIPRPSSPGGPRSTAPPTTFRRASRGSTSSRAVSS
jgi:hypothetical protein